MLRFGLATALSDLHETDTVGPKPFPGDGKGVWPPGRLVADRYEIREYLGRGGYATVYRAYDRLVKIEVALKVVHPEREPERALQRLRREVEIARQSLDSHIVRVFDLGRTSDDIYLTMEFLPGGSLRKRLASGPLPTSEAVRIAIAVLQGLAALHARRAVHRDVSPGNILFSKTGEAKLADFGLARYLDTEESTVTVGGTVLGTPGYRSPEQARGMEAGPPSDLYAVGVVLFEMLTGRLPYAVASGLGWNQKAPNLRTFRPEIPRWLAALVAHLLEERVRDRYQSAEKALRDLTQEKNPRLARLRRYALRTAALLFLCLPQVGVFVVPAAHAKFSHLVPAGATGVKAISASGETLWTLPGVASEIADRGTLARIEPNGPRRLAIVLSRAGDWSLNAVSTLTFLDPDSGGL